MVSESWNIERVACIGAGVVGVVTAATVARQTGLSVTVLDTNKELIAAWSSDRLPLYEPGLLETLQQIKADAEQPTACRHDQPHGVRQKMRRKIAFTTDEKSVITSADLIFLCVGTPTKSHGPGAGKDLDLTHIERATRSIAQYARRNTIVVEKSTVPCGTAKNIRSVLDAAQRCDVRFEVVSNPEFIARSTALQDMLHPDRVLIGSDQTLPGQAASSALFALYAQWVPRERILLMNSWSAELAKLTANAFLAQRVSNISSLSAMCESMGAKIQDVALAVGLDSRIGPAMLKPGAGFGGSCLEKDTSALVYLAESLGLLEVADYWRSVLKINEYHKLRIARRIIDCMGGSVQGEKIAILGFEYKNSTSDATKSPAACIANFLSRQGAIVHIHDPALTESQIRTALNQTAIVPGSEAVVHVSRVHVSNDSMEQAFKDAKALVIIKDPKVGQKQEGWKASVSISSSQVPQLAARPNSSSWPDFLQSTKVKEASVPLCKVDNKTEYEEISCCSGRDEQSEWGKIVDIMADCPLIFDVANVLSIDKLKAVGLNGQRNGEMAQEPRPQS